MLDQTKLDLPSLSVLLARENFRVHGVAYAAAQEVTEVQPETRT